MRRGSFLDLFAGTGVVATRALDFFDRIVINDHLHSNSIIYEAFYGLGSTRPKILAQFVAEMNSNTPDLKKSNYFSKNYGGLYFSKPDAIQIGNIREQIDSTNRKFSRKERAILIASLIYSADRVANTVGHYETFLKNQSLTPRFKYRLISYQKNSKVEIHRRDANELVREVESDVVYIDPPYNSRQYSRFYHVLETLTKWDNPALFGVARKPPTENSSDYCKVVAPIAFADLIANVKAKLVVVSYNSTYESKSSSSRNKISLQEIFSILQTRGATKRHEFSHRFFETGKTRFESHSEYVFVTTVDQ